MDFNIPPIAKGHSRTMETKRGKKRGKKKKKKGDDVYINPTPLKCFFL